MDRRCQLGTSRWHNTWRTVTSWNASFLVAADVYYSVGKAHLICADPPPRHNNIFHIGANCLLHPSTACSTLLLHFVDELKEGALNKKERVD